MYTTTDVLKLLVTMQTYLKWVWQVSTRTASLVTSLFDLKLYSRKLHLCVLVFGKDFNSEYNSKLEKSSIFNPPWHPVNSLFENLCDFDIQHLLGNQSRLINCNFSKDEIKLRSFCDNREIRLMKPHKGGGVGGYEH